jgi:hypothetical protein
MSQSLKWSTMNEEQKQKYNNNEDQFDEAMQQTQILENENNNVDNNNNNNNNQDGIQGIDQKEYLTIEQINTQNKIKFNQDGIANIMLKPNQQIFNINYKKLNQNWGLGALEDFNRFLSKDNQFRKATDFAKTKDPNLVLKIFDTLFKNDDARICLKYLCSFSLGGKYKDDRKKMNRLIRDTLLRANLYPYGEKNECGYNGLLKLAPLFLSDIRRSTLKEKEHPFDKALNVRVNYYTAGLESNFEFNSLKIMGCNQASLNFCYTKLLLSVDTLSKKKSKNDADMKLIKRLSTLSMAYVVSDHITKKDSTIRVVEYIKNMDLKNSDINFDIFGYE